MLAASGKVTYYLVPRYLGKVPSNFEKLRVLSRLGRSNEGRITSGTHMGICPVRKEVLGLKDPRIRARRQFGPSIKEQTYYRKALKTNNTL